MNDLEQLKNLLFGAEKEALDSIAERVERPEIRTTDVADVLPEAIHQSYRKDDELVESLTEPVGECLRQAFRDDPQTYGDALYPVMGPAIRKSIMHTLRTFAQQINEAVEQSVSPKGLKWRWQASRAGIPFGEFVLQRTLRYRVEQAYLISRENGLLVGHVHHEASKIKDSDAVSAMFTAIQDFVKESFSPDRTGRLESADMGEFTLWAVHGPHALLVCVIRGVPPKSLRGDLSAILERIHFRYGDAIREYRGDTSTVPDAEIELERCLRFEAKHEDNVIKRGPSVVLIIILLLLAAGAVYWGVQNWMQSTRLDAFREALVTTPGIHVTDLERNGEQILLRGLKDPLARPVGDIAASVDIPAEAVVAELQAFQSLEPGIVLLRAEHLFARPDGIEFKVDDSMLIVTGAASAAWLRDLQDGYERVAGIDSLDITATTVTDWQRLESEVAALSGRRFLFSDQSVLAEGMEQALLDYGRDVHSLLAEAHEAGYRVSVALTGSTDRTGPAEINAVLAMERAANVGQILTSIGVMVSEVRRAPVESGEADPVYDASKRNVQVDLRIDETPQRP